MLPVLQQLGDAYGFQFVNLIHCVCTGVLKCVIYYGGIYLAASNTSFSVLPLPRATISPRLVTSERDVMQEITCSAEFPAVTSDVVARVEWFTVDGRSLERLRDSQWMMLQPRVHLSGINCSS